MTAKAPKRLLKASKMTAGLPKRLQIRQKSSLGPSKHRFIKFQGPAAGAKPLDSPHPFRGAGRDGTVAELCRVFRARWASPPPPAPPQKHHKIEEKTRLQKYMYFLHKIIKEWASQWTPKSLKIASRHFFCVIEKTLNSASVFFLAFTVSGTPGPSKIFNFLYKYNRFRNATLFSKITPFCTNLW